MRAYTLQNNFTGGELSPFLHARSDIPKYQNGAKSIKNMIPMIYGGALKRDGSIMVSEALDQDYAKNVRLIPFRSSDGEDYVIEMGEYNAALHDKNGPVALTSPEILLNPNFDTNATNWAFSGGLWSSSNGGSFQVNANLALSQIVNKGIIHGETYQLRIIGVSLSNIRVTVTGALGLLQVQQNIPNGNIDHTIEFKANGSNHPNLIYQNRRNFIENQHSLTVFFEQIPSTTSSGFIQSISLKKKRNAISFNTFYSSADLPYLRYEQRENEVYIFNKSYPTGIIRRLSNDNWRFSYISYSAPYEEVGHPSSAYGDGFAATLTISGTTITSDLAVFLTAYVGRNVTTNDGGIYNISAFTSPTNVTVTVIREGFSTTYLAGSWSIDGSPLTACTPSAVGPVGATITITGSLVCFIAPIDIGSIVHINGGILRIQGITTSGAPFTGFAGSIANCVVLKALNSTVAAISGSWFIERNVYSLIYGYPNAGSFFEQRFMIGGGGYYKNAIAGSSVGAYGDFFNGTDDTDAVYFVMSESSAEIEHLVKMRGLLALTQDGIFSISGGVERALSPTNVQIKAHSDEGCNHLKPIKVLAELYFVDKTGKRLISANYDYSVDTFDTEVESKISEHITAPGIKNYSYRRHPYSQMWFALDNGKAATYAVDKKESVAAWSQHATDGLYEDFCAIKANNSEIVYQLVKRTIGGVPKRFIERQEAGLYMDCAIRLNSVTALTVWTGLSHLEGKSVWAIGDDTFLGSFTVASGQITIPSAVNDIVIGLPYDCELIPLPVSIGLQDGVSETRNVRVSKVGIKVIDSLLGVVNGETIGSDNVDYTTIDDTIEPFTGTFEVTRWGRKTVDDSDALDPSENDDLVITQNAPYPFHVLSVMRRVTVNG